VFERFSEPARQVVVLAQDEARTLKHNYIGTEHLLLGLLRDEESIAARALRPLGVTLEEARGQVAQIVGFGDEQTVGQIPFTPRGKRVLELSYKQALALGHDYIGPEHILLGIVRENEGVASRILLDFGAGPETIREELNRILSGATGRDGSAEKYRRSDVLVLERSRRPRWLGPGTTALLPGWVLLGFALGVGILVGWLIWG
jgi:ATP-dependent Clp protease ATP-binding subunit ClpC